MGFPGCCTALVQTGAEMTPLQHTRLILDEAEMTALAARLAARVVPPMVIYLHGDLGAGKTTFARAFIQSLGYEGRVKSPTYGLLERYPTASAELVHLDLYRIQEPGELEFLGLDDLQTPLSIFLVEWPSQGTGFLPKPDLEIRFGHKKAVRELEFVSNRSEIAKLCADLAKNIE